jgi:hypothetical protein
MNVTRLSVAQASVPYFEGYGFFAPVEFNDKFDAVHSCYIVVRSATNKDLSAGEVAHIKSAVIDLAFPGRSTEDKDGLMAQLPLVSATDRLAVITMDHTFGILEVREYREYGQRDIARMSKHLVGVKVFELTL